MTGFFIYLLKVIVCSAMFAGCYWWVLRNGRFYQWNRFYIVTSVVLSIIIPLLNIPMSTPHVVMTTASSYISQIVIDPVEITAIPAQPETSTVSWSWLGWIACMCIIFFLLMREGVSLIRILRLKRRSKRIHIPETVLYCTDDAAAPFSFFRTIFWKKGVPVDSSEGRCMLRHELAHVQLGHSWDKALMQLVCCLFWMNPFFMLFRRELELVHEFAADSESNAEELSSLILCTLYPNHYRDFTSRFFQSSIKRRIVMITKNTCASQVRGKKSKMNLLRKMSIVPVVFIALYLFACNSEGRRDSATEISQPLSESVWQDSWKPQNDMEEPLIVVGYNPMNKGVISPNNDVTVTHDSERKVARGVISYDEVEQKPVFQGTDNNFRWYLAQNFRYPADAFDNGIAGTVVVSFVIDKDGNVTDVKSPVKIDILSDEVERLIKSSPAWKPGKQGGKDVAVQCYAFVEFKLDLAASTPSESEDVETVTFALVKEKPTFNGQDAEAGFREWVLKNTVYPFEVQEKGISGRVYVEFTIDTDGSVINAKIMRGVDPLLDAEALRVIKLSPKWTPGKHEGKAVRVKYTYPFVFKWNN